MHRLLVSMALVVLAALPLLCTTAFGATPTAPPPAQPPVPHAIEPIAPSAILTRADSDEQFFHEIMTQAREPDPAQKLVGPLDALTAGISKLSKRYSRQQLQSLPVIRLENLDRYWQFYDDRLFGWRDELRRVTNRYSEGLAELVKRRAVWEATQKAAAASGLARALRNRVKAVLAQIALAEKTLSDPLNSQLDLARRGNAAQAEIDSARNAIKRALANVERRLLEIDGPPFLKAWSDRAPSKQALSTLKEGLRIEKEFLEEYLTAYAGRQRALGIVALVLLPVLLWARRRTRRLVSGDAVLSSSTLVLQRPISSWLIVVALSVLYFETAAPMILRSSALLLLLIPGLRLLPRRVYAVFGSWPYVATALYLFYLPGFLLLGAPLLDRLHMLVTGMLMLAALLGLLMRLRRQAGTSLAASHSATLRAVGWLFAAALLVGLVANGIGNVSLSEVLTGGVVFSGYMGLALYAANEVVRAILTLLVTNPAVSKIRGVTKPTEGLLHSLGRLLSICAIGTWVVVTLKVFLVYRPVATWVDGILKRTFDLGQISISLGGVLVFVVSVWVSFLLAKAIRFVLHEEVLPKVTLPRGAATSISTLTYYAVVTTGLMVAFVAAGFQVSQLAIVLGALGVGIGFGLQNLVNNLISGLILMFERPIRPGDVIEVSGTSGKVEEIGVRATALKTFDGADVVMPNGTLLSERIINWTLKDMDRRFDVNVGVSYGSDLKRVLEILMDTAKATPGVSAPEKTDVIFVGFGASSFDFRVRAWTNDYDNWVAIQSDLTVRVYDALMAAGVKIPFPQRDLHLRSISREVRAELKGPGSDPAG